MNVGRLCSIEGGTQHQTHQRISEYLKLVCARYHGMGFTSRVEWVGEQTVQGLRLMLQETDCTQEERTAITNFLDLAVQEMAGPA